MMPIVRNLLQRRLEWLAFVGVLLIALALRFSWLEGFPPGIQHDEVFIANFAQTILQGQYPIFFEANRGNYPFFIYLVAASFKLWGTNVWALRAVAALCGSSALVLTYLLAREWFGSLVALVTAIGLAFSFWLLFASRVGLHAVTTFLLAAATFIVFWYGWTRGHRLWLIASGILAGIATYTYLGGIFVPFALALFVVYSVIWHRTIWKNNLWVVPVIFLLAALIYTPLAYYISTHAETSLARLGDLSGDLAELVAGNPLPLLGNALGIVGMFGIRGDPEWRYNIALQPVFNPLWAVLFYVGLFIALRRLGQPAFAFAIIWLGVMVLPSALSPNNPSHHRSTGAIGAVYMFPAIALYEIGKWMQARWQRQGTIGFAVAAVTLTMLAAFLGVRDYFLVWTSNRQVREIYRADLAEAAHWLDANARGERVMISASFANDLDRGAFNLESTRPHQAHFFSGTDTLVLPEDTDALYVNPQSGAMNEEKGRGFLQSSTPLYTVRGPEQANELEIYRFSADELKTRRNSIPDRKLARTSNDEIALWDAEVPTTILSGQSFRVRVWWQVITPRHNDPDNLHWVLRLTDSTDYVWSEVSGLGYTPSMWQPGDLVLSAYDLEVPADAPPQPYSVQFAIGSKDGALPLLDRNGKMTSALTLGMIQVARGPVPTVKPQLPVRYPSKVKFNDAIQLLGSDAISQVQTGGTWQLVLFWTAYSDIPVDYKLRLLALTESGQPITQYEEILLARTYPTHLWRAGEYLRSVQNLRIPVDAPRGKAIVRLFLLDAEAKPIGRSDGVPIAGIEITGRARNFARPTPAHPRALRFGDNIELIGYDLSADIIRAGESISVTLDWHARTPSDNPYTVFVHLLNASGQIIGQIDSPPLGGNAPTDTWQAGEYLEDTFTFAVAPDAQAGSAVLEIGFYDPATGSRLPVFDDAGKDLGDHFWIEGLTVKR